MCVRVRAEGFSEQRDVRGRREKKRKAVEGKKKTKQVR